MAGNPDDPRVIKREQYEERIWEELCDELGRDPTDEEYEDALEVGVLPPDDDDRMHEMRHGRR